MMEFIIILLIGILAYAIYDMVLTKKENKKYGVSDVIKNTYQKILVPVNEINILSRDYYEDDENGWIQVKAIDSLVKNRNIRSAHKYISIITYDDFLYHGKKYSFHSTPIALSDVEIRNKLAMKETVTIYYDHNDITKYNFDLSFIL